MGFKPGDKRPENSGRKPGTPNRRTFDARKLAEEKGVDPLEILLDTAAGNWKALGYEDQHVTKFSMGIPYQEERVTMDHRVAAAKEAAKYVYPQLKSVELTGKDGANLFAERLAKAQARVTETLVGGAIQEGEE